MREEEEPKLIVNRAMLLNENGSAKQSVRRIKKDLPKSFSKVYLRFPSLSDALVAEVKSLIANNSGAPNVIFYVTSTKSYHPYERLMSLNIDTYNALIDILGEENVVPK